MSSLDKLIGKIEKAQSAVKSFKGTLSKFQNLNFNSIVDSLGEQKGLANKILEGRRASLKKQLSARNLTKTACKSNPDGDVIDLIYPQELFSNENYITFATRKRVKRADIKSQSGITSSGGETVIHLYIPDTLLSQANVQYKNEGVSSLQRTLGGFFQDPSSVFGEGTGQAIGDTAAKFVTKMADGLTGGALTASVGIAQNPMREMMFEGVGFRSWNFTYEFYPKSRFEADQVNQIIYNFRNAMLPDSFSFGSKADNSANGDEASTILQDAFFNYPNVFDIEFSGPVADKIDGFLPSVCTKCDVDHTGGQKFSVYEDGQPIKTTMTLEFMEIRLLTQNNYQSISNVSGKKGLANGGQGYMDRGGVTRDKFKDGWMDSFQRAQDAVHGVTPKKDGGDA